jgi:DNA-damage-inducible protein J
MLYIKCNDDVHTQIILKHQERPMAKTATIQTRVDPEIKRNAQKILSTLNISMSEAISIYLTQITQESENGSDLHKVSNIDELFQELNS